MYWCCHLRFVSFAISTALCLTIFAAGPGFAQPAKNRQQSNAQLTGQNPQKSRATEQQLRKTLAEKGNDPFVLHQLGDVLYRQGKIREARKVWNEAARSEEHTSELQSH